MATISFSITVPDDKRAEIIQDFTDYHGYTVIDGVTRAEFARRLVIGFIRSSVRSHRAQQAAEAARTAAIAGVDGNGME